MQGLLMGVLTFFLIGLFHPLVIYGEYYWGRRILWAFLTAGLITTAIVLFVSMPLLLNILLGVLACCCFWSIIEVRDQETRVLKGWYPENPKRHDYYVQKRQEQGYPPLPETPTGSPQA